MIIICNVKSKQLSYLFSVYIYHWPATFDLSTNKGPLLLPTIPQFEGSHNSMKKKRGAIKTSHLDQNTCPVGKRCLTKQLNEIPTYWTKRQNQTETQRVTARL